MWDEPFEQLLRTHIPLLGPDDEFSADLSLRDFGLDSMGMVALLSGLEETYSVRFVDDALDVTNFATPATLWKTLTALR
ncbi:acyl carrier protein [Actinomadura gamaensis]|uniref:Acyl carrier protein n=1 Tax=Actinomadura gamaensis TaxID=1763541 RepID=A0ABV9TUD4_9ACTN